MKSLAKRKMVSGSFVAIMTVKLVCLASSIALAEGGGGGGGVGGEGASGPEPQMWMSLVFGALALGGVALLKIRSQKRV